MKKIYWVWLSIIRCKILKIIVLYGIISIGLLAPMGSLTVLPDIMDTPNHVEAIVQARNAISEHQLPLRVAPTLVNGWQYPLFQFYSPTPYTIGGLIYKFITRDNPYAAYAITLWLALTAAALGVYFLSNRFIQSQKISVIAGLAYITAPYILLNLHARGGFTEVFSQAVLPYVLLFSLNVFSKKQIHWIILGGLSWYLMITSHLITFLTLSITVVFVALLLLVLLMIKKNLHAGQWMGFFRLGLSYVLGLMLACYYLAPVVLFSGNGIEPPKSPSVTTFFSPLLTLLSPASIAQNPSQPDNMTFHFYPAVGWVFILSFLTILHYLTLKKQTQEKPFTGHPEENNRLITGLLCGLFLISVLLTWSPVDIWQYIPGANFVQHSYRFLVHVVWSGSLLLAYALRYLFWEFENKHVLIGTFLLVLACLSYLPSNSPAGSVTIEDLKEKPIISALDYLYYPELASTGDTQTVLSGKSLLVTNGPDGLRRSDGKMIVNISVPLGVDYVQLPVLYYPGLMQIRANDQVVDYWPVYFKDMPFFVNHGHVWLTGIPLKPGHYAISVDFTGIDWANNISLLVWVLVLLTGLVVLPLFWLVKKPVMVHRSI